MPDLPETWEYERSNGERRMTFGSCTKQEEIVRVESIEITLFFLKPDFRTDRGLVSECFLSLVLFLGKTPNLIFRVLYFHSQLSFC